MSAAERTLDFHPPPGGDDILEAEPSKSAPHLASILQNVTVDKALDSIARILEGVVFYGDCTTSNGKGLFRIDFMDGS